MKFRFSILAVIICISGPIKSQSDFDLSQRLFNESVYNPGATGNNFSTGIFFHSRSQWTGLEGAPVTTVITVDTYAEPINSGIGISVYNDKIGYLTSWSSKLSYAYYISIGEKSSLSLGLSGYLNNRSSHMTPDMLEDIVDPASVRTKISEYHSDFDFGMEYLGALKAGVAIRHLRNSDLVNTFFVAHSISVWTYASSRFNILQRISIEPAISYMQRSNVRRIEGGAIAYFFKNTSRTQYNDKFWLGAMFRLNKQFAMLAGINLTSKIRLGYSFDYGAYNDLASISKLGTHELFLSWHFSRVFYKEIDCPAYRKHKIKY
jgi:type IX secretion system PorP/SprF family membrane protein